AALAGIVRDWGRPEVACRLFDAAAEIQRATGRSTTDGFRRARENLGACYARLGRYAESREIYDALAAAFPGSGRGAMGRGYLELHTFDFDGAAAEWARASSLDATLAPSLARASATLDDARKGRERFADDAERTSSRIEYAEYLAAIGRGPDAEFEYL